MLTELSLAAASSARHVKKSGGFAKPEDATSLSSIPVDILWFRVPRAGSFRLWNDAGPHFRSICTCALAESVHPNRLPSRAARQHSVGFDFRCSFPEDVRLGSQMLCIMDV